MVSHDPIRQVAESQWRQFLDALPSTGLDHRGVHQLRVLTKQWRAYLLLYPAHSCPQATVVRARLKRLADRHGGARDAVVVAKTLARVTAAWRPEQRQALADWLASTQAPLTETGGLSAASLKRRLRQCLRDWPVPPASWQPGAGVGRLYRKAARTGRRALASGDDGDYHRWRKWTKQLFYCLDVVTVPAVGGKRRKRLKKLGERLGRHQDLAMLEQRLCQQPVPAALDSLVAQVLRRIHRRKRRNKKRFSRSYGRLYAADARFAPR